MYTYACIIMYMCVHVYTRMCVYRHTSDEVLICTHICACLEIPWRGICIHTNLCVYIEIFLRRCSYTYTYVCIWKYLG